jgi:hypothetical protein
MGTACSDAWDVAREQAQDGADAGITSRQTQNPAREREQQALCKKLPDKPAPSGTHRCANRDLAFSGGRAREQKICHIGAGDQQHEAYYTHKNQQRIPDAACDGSLQSLYAEPSPREIDARPLAREPWIAAL